MSQVEDPATLWFEQSNYVSTHLAAIGYGLQLAVFSVVTYFIIEKRHSTKKWAGWLFVNSMLFVLGTISLACVVHFNQCAWINERDYPGGPFAFMLQQQTRPILILGNSASITASFVANGLLLYRVIVLWDFVWYIIMVPVFLYTAGIVLAILTVVQIAVPSIPFAFNLSMPVWIILMGINILLSAMIAIRILYMQRSIRNSLGGQYAKQYTNIASLVIETALPFAIISIILLVLFGGRNTAQNLFIPLLVQVECIAPQLIILRVILGRIWSSKRLSPPVSQPLRFAPRQPSGWAPPKLTHGNTSASSSDIHTEFTMSKEEV